MKPLRFLGKISYSLYLWHWGILSLGRWTIGNYSWSIFLQIILLILVSTFSYFYIEKPFSESSQFFKSFNYILKSLLAVFFSILYLLGIWRLIGNKIYLGKIYKIEKEFKEIKFFENCNLYKNTKDSVNLSEKCGAIIYKDKPTIYLLGDSHAQQFNNSIKEFASKRHINVKTIWGIHVYFLLQLSEQKINFALINNFKLRINFLIL